MTTEIRERSINKSAETAENPIAVRRQYRSWMRCPRCIGGNMYHDNTGENVCIQCGYAYFPDKLNSAKMG